MQKPIFILGAVVAVVFAIGIADAKKPGRGNDQSSPGWNGTSPPGFSQGDKAWRTSTPPGWAKNRGNKRGWNDQSMPPGLYKRQ